MTRYLAITTCTAKQWTQYGRAMARTFVRFWPADIPLRIYAEGFDPGGDLPIESVDLESAAPWLSVFKVENGHRKPESFKQDAVRFAHKMAAMGAAAEGDDCDVLIWLDADIVTHSLVRPKSLAALFPEPAAVAWLDRADTYPETGVLMFRLPQARPVIARCIEMYVSGEVYKLPGQTDCHVIQHAVEAAARRGEIEAVSLSGDARKHKHPAINGPLGACLDHLKGRRKEFGRSRAKDLMRPRSEPYWQ